jgi:sugar lactone lactonase YvrE
MNRQYIYSKLIILLLFSHNLLIGQNESIYVCDAGNFNTPPWQIIKYDADGKNPEVFIKDQLAWPQDILFIEDQQIVLISNLSTGRISKHDAQNGDYKGIFAASINGPTRIKIGPDGLLYVLQWGGNGKVLRYKLDGTSLGPFTSSGVYQSIGLDWDKEGNLYISSYGSDLVRKFDPTGQDMGNFISTNLVGPTNIWFSSDGQLNIVDYDGGDIKRFDENGKYLGTYITGLSQPEGVDFLADGNILIGNGGTGAVLMFDKDGAPLGEFVTRKLGGLIRPNAVVVRSAPSRTTDELLDETPFVTPSIGKTFTVNPDVITNVISLNIYNANGQWIDTISGNTWQANDRSSGSYIIKGITHGKKVLIQRIIVSD